MIRNLRRRADRARMLAWSLLSSAAILIFSEQPAHAYLDPGAGSYLMQLLMAAFLGALFSVKLYWKKIVALFSVRSARRAKEHPDDV